MSAIPNVRIVIGACVVAVAGYSVFSAWAVFWSDDAALRGDVIGTWKSFAVAAFAFWIGSSSGGKANAAPEPGTTTTTTTVEPTPDAPGEEPTQGAVAAAHKTAGAAVKQAEKIEAEAGKS